MVERCRTCPRETHEGGKQWEIFRVPKFGLPGFMTRGQEGIVAKLNHLELRRSRERTEPRTLECPPFSERRFLTLFLLFPSCQNYKKHQAAYGTKHSLVAFRGRHDADQSITNLGCKTLGKIWKKSPKKLSSYETSILNPELESIRA